MPPGLLSPQGGKFEEEEREANKQALSNIMSDTLSGGLLGVAVATNRRRVGLLRGWLGERFLSLEASTQVRLDLGETERRNASERPG